MENFHQLRIEEISPENKLRNTVTSIPGMYDEFPPKDGGFKRIGVLLILDGNALASRERLLKINLALRTFWACTAV